MWLWLWTSKLAWNRGEWFAGVRFGWSSSTRTENPILLYSSGKRPKIARDGDCLWIWIRNCIIRFKSDDEDKCNKWWMITKSRPHGSRDCWSLSPPLPWDSRSTRCLRNTWNSICPGSAWHDTTSSSCARQTPSCMILTSHPSFPRSSLLSVLESCRSHTQTYATWPWVFGHSSTQFWSLAWSTSPLTRSCLILHPWWC